MTETYSTALQKCNFAGSKYTNEQRIEAVVNYMDRGLAEKAALGYLMLGGDLVEGINFVAGDFVIPVHQEIFSAIQLLKETGQPTDAVTVYESMARKSSESKLLLGLLERIVRDAPTTSDGLLEILRQ